MNKRTIAMLALTLTLLISGGVYFLKNHYSQAKSFAIVTQELAENKTGGGNL